MYYIPPLNGQGSLLRAKQKATQHGSLVPTGPWVSWLYGGLEDPRCGLSIPKLGRVLNFKSGNSSNPPRKT